MKNYLKKTICLDFDSKEVQALIAEFKTNDIDEIEKAKGIYLKIRDEWRYNPYSISFDAEKYKASTIAQRDEGHCVDKAILLAACLRGLNIPSRLRFAKVTNHIAVEKLTERFGTNVLTPHGMVEVYLNQKWLKATPAFNKELCEMCNVKPLEFDGENDSMFQEYNGDGQQFMEYLEDYGHFDDVPLTFMRDNMMEHYPEVFNSNKVDYSF
ncbi:transglutaminase-like domain-containing protein [Croceivirga thetidis]|uniref:Transglutaminase family protein n=1 Tax=Croceivirga thetidis TaxID=2721623 RepID=A0ABX1GQT9_9FLAO|nr:transglutaminase family protein [Croceivirga thetidis]NKI32302.1 transglutaminase family protein [Croceivirga thetidis]